MGRVRKGLPFYFKTLWARKKMFKGINTVMCHPRSSFIPPVLNLKFFSKLSLTATESLRTVLVRTQFCGFYQAALWATQNPSSLPFTHMSLTGNPRCTQASPLLMCVLIPNPEAPVTLGCRTPTSTLSHTHLEVQTSSCPVGPPLDQRRMEKVDHNNFFLIQWWKV